MSPSFGLNEPLSCPKNALFCGVMCVYFVSFFLEHPVVITILVLTLKHFYWVSQKHNKPNGNMYFSVKQCYVFWDTLHCTRHNLFLSGQERYRCLSRAYLKGCQACIIVCDVTRPDTFVHAEIWKRDVDTKCGEIPTLMLANKVINPTRRGLWNDIE